MSRVFVFDLGDGQQACMELYIIPRSKDFLDPQLPFRPSNEQILQTLGAASQTTIQHFTKP